MGTKNMTVSGIDPRYVSEEVHNPVYRVDFWDESRASHENRLENARSIDEVLAWAEANRHGHYVVIWAEYNYEGGIGILRLRGWEPTEERSPSARTPTSCNDLSRLLTDSEQARNQSSIMPRTPFLLGQPIARDSGASVVLGF